MLSLRRILIGKIARLGSVAIVGRLRRVVIPDAPLSVSFALARIAHIVSTVY